MMMLPFVVEATGGAVLGLAEGTKDGRRLISNVAARASGRGCSSVTGHQRHSRVADSLMRLELRDIGDGTESPSVHVPRPIGG